MSLLDRSVPPPPAAIRPFAFPAVRRDRLDNGLSLLSARHGDLPIVTIELVLDAGAAFVPPEQAGLARLTLNALETGTRRRSADDIAWRLEHLGAELESQAGWDAALLRLTVPTERLAPAFTLLAELVLEPAFPAAEVERLRDEQLAEILQRAKSPGSLASDMAAHFIFAPEVPYARPLIGTSAAVGRLGRDDVAAFHRARYRPGAAALVLVGDVDAATARRLAVDHLGDWRTAPAETHGFDVRPAREGSAVHVVDRPGSVQSEIRIGHVGVERAHVDYFPILVMNTILGGAFASRLNMSLREKHGFTYGAHSGFGFRRRPGPFLIQVAVATEVTAPAIREALREVHRLRDDGPSDDEVADARDYIAGTLPLELQTTDQLAARLAEIAIYQLGDDFFRTYAERTAAVTAEDVRRVSREHLRPDAFAIVLVGDAAQVVPALEEAGITPVEVHAAPSAAADVA